MFQNILKLMLQRQREGLFSFLGYASSDTDSNHLESHITEEILVLLTLQKEVI